MAAPHPGSGMPLGWQGKACALYATGMSISKICKEIGISRGAFDRHKNENYEGFGDNLKAAGETFNDRIRDEIVDRAFDKEFRGSDMWLERLAQWRLPETKLAALEQEEARADQLADALERFQRLVAARSVRAALPDGAGGVAGVADGSAEGGAGVRVGPLAGEAEPASTA